VTATPSNAPASEHLRSIIVQALTGMLLLLLMMMVADLIEMGMLGQFSGLAKDPGVKGLRFIIVVACLNVAAQTAARLAHGKASRFGLLGFVLLYTLVFVGHLANHARVEGVGFHSLLDLAHTLLGTWASCAALRLARA
jgi:hypothetical protein